MLCTGCLQKCYSSSTVHWAKSSLTNWQCMRHHLLQLFWKGWDNGRWLIIMYLKKSCMFTRDVNWWMVLIIVCINLFRVHSILHLFLQLVTCQITLLCAQDKSVWSNSYTQRIFQILLNFTIHPKPRVSTCVLTVSTFHSLCVIIRLIQSLKLAWWPYYSG